MPGVVSGVFDGCSLIWLSKLAYPHESSGRLSPIALPVFRPGSRRPFALAHTTFQVICQGVKAALPKPSIGGDPFVGLPDRSRFQSQNVAAPTSAPLEKSRSLEDPQVLRHRRPRDPQRSRQLARSRISTAEAFEDHPPSWVGERGEEIALKPSDRVSVRLIVSNRELKKRLVVDEINHCGCGHAKSYACRADISKENEVRTMFVEMIEKRAPSTFW